MLKNISIKTLLIVSFAVVLLLVSIINVALTLKSTSSILEDAEHAEIKRLYDTAQSEIRTEGELALALANTIAKMDYLDKLFAEDKRQQLADALANVYGMLKKDYRVRQFQYHTPPAISYLRLHKPAKFGDDLSSFRKTVVETNTKLKNISGLEKGVAGLGIRGVVPVFYQDKHIGSVEFGMSFGQAFFDNFKQKYGIDIALYVRNDDGFKAFGTTMKRALLSEAQLNRAMTQAPVMLRSKYDNRKVGVYADKVVDFSGNPVGVLEVVMDRTRYADSLASVRNRTILIGLVALVVGILIALVIARLITKPLVETVAAMDEIAQGGGDLTRRLDQSGKNEVGNLARAFNSFAEKVRDIVGQVSAATAQLASAAEQMSAITDETRHQVFDQQSETNLVVTAMNEMTATVQEVARNATNAAQAAAEADTASKDGKSVVNSTITAIENLAAEIDSATSVISQLEQDSVNIGSVLDVIKGIAEQTNLLALNAAIEAARAGEQGRGFAVVADEVRTLANRTQQSTQEIQQMIEKLQSGAQSGVQVMNESQERASNAVDQAARAGVSLESITHSVSMINDMNTQIATAAEEQGAVAEEINKNVVNISQIVDNTAQGAEQTSSASTSLARLSVELQQLISQFKI